MKVIVADSSTLITLLDTHHFPVLFGLFDEIMISTEVYREITCQNQHALTLEQHRAQKQLSCERVAHDEFYEMLTKRLDAGESESIILAKQHQLPLLIDEKKGRAIAKSLHIPIVGLIGVILKLLSKNAISKVEAQQIIRDAEANNFRLSPSLKQLIDDYSEQ